jgi:hypothetical protein
VYPGREPPGDHGGQRERAGSLTRVIDFVGALSSSAEPLAR